MHFEFLKKTVWQTLLACALAVMCGAAVPLVYRYIVLGPVFPIKQFVFEGQKKLSAAQLQRKVERYVGKPVYGVALDEIEETLLKEPVIKAVRVIRIPPHVIKIQIKEYEPIAVLDKRPGFYMDEEGDVFSLQLKDVSALPLVAGINQPQNARLVALALQSYQAVFKENTDVQNMEFDDVMGISVKLKNGAYVILGNDGFEKKWQKLAVIIDSLKSKGHEVTYAYLGGDADTKKVAIKTRVSNGQAVGVMDGSQ